MTPTTLETIWHGPSPRQAPTLVFLHEGLGCVAMWHDFPFVLADATGCGALIYSRTGYGKSGPCHLPRPIDFMHTEALKVLPRLLNAYQIQDAILIGHSDGGSIAIIYAGGAPASPLRALITEAAHVFCEKQTIDAIENAGIHFKNGDLRCKLQKYHGPNTDCAFWGWHDVWRHPDFQKWNIESCLPAIKVPVLAIQGKNDPYGTPAQIESIAGRTTSKAYKVLLDDCGHNPHKEHKTVVIERMAAFISQSLVG
jgi:pimeloyl-ACP methyl ester carboxylesterase